MISARNFALPVSAASSQPRFARLLSRCATLLLLTSTVAAFAASPSTTTLAITSGGAAVTSVAAGQVVTLTATVSTNPGTVYFCANTRCQDSGFLGQAQVTTAGTAVLALQLGPGTYPIYTKFLGTMAFAGSSSAATTLTVTTPAGGYPLRATTLASSGAAANYNLTATLTGIVPAPIDGSVRFNDTTSGTTIGSSNVGASTFTVPTATSLTAPSGSILQAVTGDLNNDGYLDLVVITTGSVYVYNGNGDGTFATTPSVNFGISNAKYVALGDLNNDGNLDIVVASYTGNVYILVNQGNESFPGATIVNAPAGITGQIAIADVNHDGLLDIVVPTQGVYVSLNNNGSFGGALTDTGASTSYLYYGLAVADINGDGFPDIVSSPYQNSQILSVQINRGDGSGTFSQTIITGDATTSGNPTANLILADLKGDGVYDLIQAFQPISGTARVDVFQGTAAGTFPNGFTSYSVPGLIYQNGIAAVDINGDGKLDVLVGSGTTGLNLLTGNGDHTLGAATPLTSPASINPLSVVTGNFRGTGSNDIVAVSGGSLYAFYPGQSATAILNNTSAPGPGNQNVTATHLPAATPVYATSTSNAVSLVGGTVVTAVSLQASPAGTSAAGTSITLTATLIPATSNGFSATGSIVFYNGSTVLSTQTLTAGAGTYAYTTTFPVGKQSFTAAYSGDTNFVPSTSPVVGYSSTSASTKLVFLNNPPTTIAAGSNAGIIRIAEEDGSGNIVSTSGNAISIAVTSTAPTYSQNYTANTSNGIATFDLSTASLLTAGATSSTYTYTPSATRNGSALTAAVASEIVNTTTVYMVNVLTDGSGACTNQNVATPMTDTGCSLRQAMSTGNSATGGAAVIFAPALFGTNYNAPAIITATSSLPIQLNSFNFSGPGPALLTISGGNTPASGVPGNSKAFTLFKYGATAAATIAISGMTIANTYGSSNSSALSVIAASQTVTVNNVAFVSNRAGSNGSAVYFSTNASGAIATFNNCTFTGNYAGASGGAIYFVGSGTLTISNSYFSGNTAVSTAGGAIYTTGGTLTLANDTFYNNTAGTLGAAISSNTVTIISDSTIVGNTSNSTTNGVGGFYKGTTGSLKLYNTVIEANTTAAPTGTADFSDGVTPTAANNLTSSGVTSPYTLATLGLGAPSVITASGQYSYGGPTPVLPILPGSPLLGQGVGTNPGSPTTDQRGFPRAATGAVDLGAEQSNLALAFSQQPPPSTATNSAITPAPAVQLQDTGYLLNATVPVTIGLSPGNLSSGSTTTVNTAAGTASFANLIPTSAQTSTVLSASSGASPFVYSVSSNSFAIPATASQLGFISGPATPITAGGNAGTVTVAAQDNTGATVTNNTASITLAVTGPNAYSNSYMATAVNGVATFNLTAVPLNAAGTYTYTATSTGLTQAQTTETVNAGAVAAFVVSGLSTFTAPRMTGTATVTAVDAGGNTVTGFTGTVTLGSNDASATYSPNPYTFVAGDNGSHAFSVTFNTAGTFTVTATSGATTGGETVAVQDAIWILNADDSVFRLTDAGVQTTSAAGSTNGTGAQIGGVAFDNAGNVWVTNQDADAYYKYSPSGVTLAHANNIGGLSAPQSVFIDGLGNAWFANQGNGSITVLSNAGAAITPGSGYQPGTLNIPTSLVIDSSGDVWVTSFGANTVVKIIGGAAPVVTPTVTGTTNNTLGARP